MKRIALFGGTFNPPHLGHLRMLEQVQARLRFDRIFVLPAAVPPHKDTAQAVAFEHRMAMCHLAFQGFEGLEVSDYEYRRTGRSYTYETLQGLRAENEAQRLYFITGADAYRAIPTWYRWQDVFDLACFVMTKRPGYTLTGCAEVDAAAARSREGLILLSVRALDVSSTAIRTALAKGQDSLQLVPSVLDYIRCHGLYQNEGDTEHEKSLS